MDSRGAGNGTAYVKEERGSQAHSARKIQEDGRQRCTVATRYRRSKIPHGETILGSSIHSYLVQKLITKIKNTDHIINYRNEVIRPPP